MSDDLELLNRIDKKEVDPTSISTSQAIMAALAFDRPDWMQHGWDQLTEQEQLQRLNDSQIAAIKQFKQAKLS